MEKADGALMLGLPRLSPDEARARLLEGVKPLAAEEVSLLNARGRILAEKILANRDQPPAPMSAMDGYAIRAGDLPGPFEIVGEAPAGRAFSGVVGAGKAVKIATGGVVPQGADKVVVQEIFRTEGDLIHLKDKPSGEDFIRPAGLDFKAGETLLTSGALIGPNQLAIIAAANRDKVLVYQKPRIAIIASGDELVAPGDALHSTQIIDSASYGVAAWVETWGGLVTQRLRLPDEEPDCRDAAATLIDAVDVIVTIGGASVGRRDVMKKCFSNDGADLVFSGVSVRPGKPFWHARRGQRFIIGLPGNPASAIVTARLFLAPMIGVLSGRGAQAFVVTETFPLLHAAASPGARETWARASMRGRCVEIDPRDDSSLLCPFAAADCFVRQPPETRLQAGEMVDVLSF